MYPKHLAGPGSDYTIHQLKVYDVVSYRGGLG
jgi:hypothetical protein